MNLLADENVASSIVDRLRRDGHTVLYVVDLAPGITDHEVLQRANNDEALLLTNDKDFGEMAFRQRLIHQGVILLRLKGTSVQTCADILSNAILKHGPEMTQCFTVISTGQLRIRRGF